MRLSINICFLRWMAFLHVRDSISVLKKSEAIVKADVVRTAEENRNVTRRIKVGRLNYEKK